MSSFLLVLHANVRNLDEVTFARDGQKNRLVSKVVFYVEINWTPNWSEPFIRCDHCSSARGGSQSHAEQKGKNENYRDNTTR